MRWCFPVDGANTEIFSITPRIVNYNIWSMINLSSYFKNKMDSQVVPGVNFSPSSSQSVIRDVGFTKAPWTSVLLSPLFKALIFASLIIHLIKALFLLSPKPCTIEDILIVMNMWGSLISLRNFYRGRI